MMSKKKEDGLRIGNQMFAHSNKIQVPRLEVACSAKSKKVVCCPCAEVAVPGMRRIIAYTKWSRLRHDHRFTRSEIQDDNQKQHTAISKVEPVSWFVFTERGEGMGPGPLVTCPT